MDQVISVDWLHAFLRGWLDHIGPDTMPRLLRDVEAVCRRERRKIARRKGKEKELRLWNRHIKQLQIVRRAMKKPLQEYQR